MNTFNMVRIAVFAPLEEPLTYALPPEFQGKINAGHRVLVPLGRRKCVGIILGEEKQKPAHTLKNIEVILDEKPIFSERQLEFLKWASEYYLCPLGEILKTALPAPLTRSKQGKKEEGRRKKKEEKEEKKIKSISKLQLSKLQQEIAEKIIPSTSSLLPSAPSFKIHLLHGITGSGKTEIYFDLMQKVLAEGKSVLNLVPEISLTPQLYQRYRNRFGDDVTLYHSALNDTERLKAWNSCREGKSKILLGTRSALFTPFENLGLIIVDEEQDNSYKQEERVRYHARDLAILRAKFENIPIVLGSATPSVESYHKAKSGKFIYHKLTERFGAAELPEIEIVDLRWDPDHKEATEKEFRKFSLLSPRILEEIQKNLKNKEQSLILLNRRGFSHYILCEDCGHSPSCPNCEITLTYHKKKMRLICHYCDHEIAPPKTCSSCMGLRFKEMGSGTEKIEEEIETHFPEARITRMDRDSTQRKGSHDAILKKLADHEIDILVGTQMIAKGHDYPNVTLVGILNADSSLHLPDFRAAEDTFQLLTQMSGRAGRGGKPGRVLLQTFNPEHYSIQCASMHQIEKFYQQELEFRNELQYPPFSRLIVLRIQGTQVNKVKIGVEKLCQKLFELKNKGILEAEILGPSPCLMEKIRNYYRWQILLKTNLNKPLQATLKKHILSTQNDWLASGLRLVVDVDPVHVI